MARRLVISSLQQVRDMEVIIGQAAVQSTTALAELLKQGAGLPTLSHIKFRRVGCDPLDPTRELNLIEQVNQTFTYLVTLKGVEYLLDRFPDGAPYQVNLGAIAGSDISSSDGRIAAEVFAATTPESNNKLQKDVEKVRATGAELKFVFYYADVEKRARVFDDVQIVRIELD